MVFSNNHSDNIVLLVEDEVLIALSTSDWIRANGYRVVTVHTGESAVQVVITCPEIKLVLMDIELGSGMDGIDAASKIIEYTDTPVAFLSTCVKEDVHEKLDHVPYVAYIQKLEYGRKLLDTIEENLGSGRTSPKQLKKKSQ